MLYLVFVLDRFYHVSNPCTCSVLSLCRSWFSVLIIAPVLHPVSFLYLILLPFPGFWSHWLSSYLSRLCSADESLLLILVLDPCAWEILYIILVPDPHANPGFWSHRIFSSLGGSCRSVQTLLPDPCIWPWSFSLYLNLIVTPDPGSKSH